MEQPRLFGYGKTFYHLDDRRHGEVDLADCVWGRRYLESLDWVDAGRVGIIGGSYGGYMVAAALAFEPEVFDVGVDVFGVTNWVRNPLEHPALVGRPSGTCSTPNSAIPRPTWSG